MILTAIDRWALEQDPSNRGYYANLSDNVLTGIILLPALTLLDHNIRQDWLDVALMYAETQLIVNTIYLYSPLGPAFQNRLRPVVYYDALGSSHARTTGLEPEFILQRPCLHLPQRHLSLPQRYFVITIRNWDGRNILSMVRRQYRLLSWDI